MKNPVRQLFVYGTLRRIFDHAAFAHISKHFTFLGEGQVSGRLYDVGYYPGAVWAGKGDFIKGELYELKPAGDLEHAMEQLDEYEGLHPAEGEKPLFKRECVQVLFDGNETEAWMYWYCGDVSGKALIPLGDYVDYLNQKNKL